MIRIISVIRSFLKKCIAQSSNDTYSYQLIHIQLSLAVSTVSHRVLLGSWINLTNLNLLGQYRLVLISYSCLALNTILERQRERQRRRSWRKLRIHVFKAIRYEVLFYGLAIRDVIDSISVSSSSIVIEVARMPQLDAAWHRLIRLPG